MVSSEFPESDSARDADFADLQAVARWWGTPRAPHLTEYHREALAAARRLDARSVVEGQMDADEFRKMWGEDPYAILGIRDNRQAAYSLYGGENAPDSEATRYQTGTTVMNTPSWAIRVDQKGVRGSAQHSGPAAGRRD